MSRKSYLPRRTFLRGVGTAMALPLLEAMMPRRTRAAGIARDPPQRMAIIYHPNGAWMQSWTPSKPGKDYALTESLEPLEDYKSDFNVITGLAQEAGAPREEITGHHARCASAFLTGIRPFKTDGANFRAGVSIDQVAAAKVGFRTRLRSLELGTEPYKKAGACDGPYSCVYTSHISWKSATLPTATEIVPRLVFERMFRGDDGSDRDRVKRLKYRRSILDLVASDARRLKSTLGRTDHQKIDEYFTSVRELELQIERAEQSPSRDRPDLKFSKGVPITRSLHIRLMYDLLVLAFQTDTTRISTFMLGNGASYHVFRELESEEEHHNVSHHQNIKSNTDMIRKIDRLFVEQFAYFLEKMKSVKEGEGTLLDNSTILYGSGISDGDAHQTNNLPILLAGRGGGTIQTGRHIKLKHKTPINNLYLSMLDRVGASDLTEFSDSTGRLKELDV